MKALELTKAEELFKENAEGMFIRQSWLYSTYSTRILWEVQQML